MNLAASTIALRLVLSIGIGLLVGFEREWSRKDLGVLIFAITALLGTLSVRGRLSPSTAAVAILTSVASALVNVPVVYRQTRRKEETRTLSALSFLLVLIGLAVLLVRERLWRYIP